MEFNLEEIGIEKDLQYECIYTTENSKGEKNAGPFGFKYLGVLLIQLGHYLSLDLHHRYFL